MTIDIPQLYISCGYNQKELLKTLSRINMTNVKEIHLANIKRDSSHTYVGRKLNDGELDIEEKVSKLIMKANSRGGTDNITIAYARMSGE